MDVNERMGNLMASSFVSLDTVTNSESDTLLFVPSRYIILFDSFSVGFHSLLFLRHAYFTFTLHLSMAWRLILILLRCVASSFITVFLSGSLFDNTLGHSRDGYEE